MPKISILEKPMYKTGASKDSQTGSSPGISDKDERHGKFKFVDDSKKVDGLEKNRSPKIEKFYEKGFALFWLLILLPIILILTFWLVGSYGFLKIHSHLNQTCRDILYEAQVKNHEVLKELFNLNPYVKSAWTVHDSAQAAYYVALASGAPKAIAATKKIYQAAKNSIRKLRIYQKSLLAKANWDRMSYLERAHRSIRSRQSQKIITSQTQIMSLHLGQFAVREKSKSRRELPEYEPQNEFSKTQRLSLKWRIRAEFKELLFLKGYGPLPRIKQEFLCGASLQAQNGEAHFSPVYWIEE